MPGKVPTITSPPTGRLETWDLLGLPGQFPPSDETGYGSETIDHYQFLMIECKQLATLVFVVATTFSRQKNIPHHHEVQVHGVVQVGILRCRRFQQVGFGWRQPRWRSEADEPGESRAATVTRGEAQAYDNLLTGCCARSH